MTNGGPGLGANGSPSIWQAPLPVPVGPWPTGDQPITPQDGAPAWQPTVYTQDRGADVQKAAAEWYDTVYGGTYTTVDGKSPDAPGTPDPGASIPAVSMAYTTPPDFIPAPATGTQSPDSSVILGEPFSIRLGDLMSCEETSLQATSNAVQAYEDLVPIVTDAINSPSIFGQIVGRGPVQLPGQYGGHFYPTSYSSSDDAGKAFASAMIPQYETALNALAGVIEAMGVWCALLNTTGQMYATADASCAYPAPVQPMVTGGGHGPVVTPPPTAPLPVTGPPPGGGGTAG
jgi:hypothetical protein